MSDPTAYYAVTPSGLYLTRDDIKTTDQAQARAHGTARSAMAHAVASGFPAAAVDDAGGRHRWTGPRREVGE